MFAKISIYHPFRTGWGNRGRIGILYVLVKIAANQDFCVTSLVFKHNEDWVSALPPVML